MKKFALSIFAFVFTLSTGYISSAAAADWEIDPMHSAVQFSVKHLMISNVKGIFKKFSGALSLDDKDVTKSSVVAEIEVESIDTGIEDRDKHLKSPDFFDVAKFPKMTFKSTKVEKAKGGLKVTGDLTIRGVTKKVVLDVEGPTQEISDPWGNVKRGVVAKTKVNRKDFGLTWNKALETGGVVVGEEVAITIELELAKKK
ncbi:MAG: YceI family protein [Myxococcota bacterium]